MFNLVKKHPASFLGAVAGCTAHFLLTAVCLVLLLLQGCAPLILAAGAGAGYLAVDKRAARKVDQSLRDLSKSITISSRRILGNRRTEKKYRYKRGSGSTVRLQETSLAPGTVHRGDRVTSILVYGVLGAPADGLIIREKRELWFNNKKLCTLRDESISRKNGTWKSRLVFKVPGSAANGTYIVKQQISYKGKKQRSKKEFIVR
ncbi:MAG TPA: hypothetical protein ENK96_00320 [Desulfobulbaceae bacterium]|nr:hypothetical protein [Desulfobulbaceae bacterium]